MIDSKRFEWKGNELYLGEEYIGRVFPAEDCIWWIEWADKTKSVDYYNKARAKDNLIKFTIRDRNMEAPPE